MFWYNGHPDYVNEMINLDTEVVAVVGHGNVALDVARILLRNPDELKVTLFISYVMTLCVLIYKFNFCFILTKPMYNFDCFSKKIGNYSGYTVPTFAVIIWCFFSCLLHYGQCVMICQVMFVASA